MGVCFFPGQISLSLLLDETLQINYNNVLCFHDIASPNPSPRQSTLNERLIYYS